MIGGLGLMSMGGVMEVRKLDERVKRSGIDFQMALGNKKNRWDIK